jgi:hypothetical protein
MPIFDHEEEYPFPIWTMDDVEVLENIDDFWSIGIVELLHFLINEDGKYEDDTLDITVVIHSVVNSLKDQYSFDEVSGLLSIASEFCLVDCNYHKQNLLSIEISDNAILYLALQEEDELALEGALQRARDLCSIFNNIVTRGALTLFGHLEDQASELLNSMLTRDVLDDTIDSTFKYISYMFTDKLAFVDFIRKMCDVGLISTEIQDTGTAKIIIHPPATGIFLLLSNRTELAIKLAHLSI